jgi:hypothetical protein
LRYELHLFTQGSVMEDIGEAVEDLANPERQVSLKLMHSLAAAKTIFSLNCVFTATI